MRSANVLHRVRLWEPRGTRWRVTRGATHSARRFPRFVTRTYESSRQKKVISPLSVLIVYFSLTSTVRTIAQAITSQVKASSQLTVCTIEPQTARGYWGWLSRSFLPNWRVPIKFTTTDLSPYDLIYLGFPKWMFSCPPVNQYIQTMHGCRGKRIALFMCHRGFDEKRYLNSMVTKVSKRGSLVVATLAVKQDAVQRGTYQEALNSFCSQIRLAVGQPENGK